MNTLSLTPDSPVAASLLLAFSRCHNILLVYSIYLWFLSALGACEMWITRRRMPRRRSPLVFIMFPASIQASYRAKEHTFDSTRRRNLQRPPAGRKSLVVWIRSNCFATRPLFHFEPLVWWNGEVLGKAGYSKCGQAGAKCCQVVERYSIYLLRLSD